MTVTLVELALYAVAMVVLTITPGPVWVATIARALSGGFAQAWPLTLGVALGDVAWSVLAVLGVGWVASTFGDVMAVFRFVAAAIFLVLGVLVLRHAGDPIGRDGRLTRPGIWAGFAAGLVVIISNPKAILFYMGFLPGFFDLSRLTPLDVVLIATVSFAVPMLGNLGLALLVSHARGLLTSPRAVKRMNVAAGVLLILVGLVIPFT
ncbi:LysE family translocator [Sinisalibacter aestuarii]|uniref:Lysine transporter LysE n=1 Tax=Sinisalibacter aestuarii TaxID=2949426 RepID=A0ABQ5LNY9_9RHOB|nr:LysE family translocator [Sinisalibacter aestuarii]GKY86714.1 lysine transporter LysE [Sinisalibacter aestuarii]